MRWILLLLLVGLTLGFVLTSIGPQVVTEFELSWSQIAGLGYSGAVVAAILTPAILYLGAISVVRATRFLGWQGTVVASVITIGAVGWLTAPLFGIHFGLPT